MTYISIDCSYCFLVGRICPLMQTHFLWPLLKREAFVLRLHCIAHVVLHNIGGDENVKTLFFFSTKEVIINLIPKFVTSILKSLVITAIWLALNHISINDSFHALNGIISVTSHRWHAILYHFFFGYKMKCICLLITASPANRSNKYCYFLNFVISKWL